MIVSIRLRRGLLACCLGVVFVGGWVGAAVAAPAPVPEAAIWSQWRGPQRDGTITGQSWATNLSEGVLKKQWRVPLGPSYSGPVADEARVYVTEAKDKQYEAVVALRKQTGEVVWRHQWEGYLKVPFFAKSNGDWIRSTPTLDEGRLYVGGMRDVLLCLNAETGRELWRVDFPKEHSAPVPEFGFVCSPLVDATNVYVQAGAALVALDKRSGTVRWKALEDGGGMWGNAFSSPVIATLGGKRQILAQTRTKLCGVDPVDGALLWEQPVEAFRGMNILTPTVLGDRVFTSAYGGKSVAFDIRGTGSAWAATKAWETKLEGYMSSPILSGDFAYLLQRNQHLACIQLRTGEVMWRTDKKFGKYWSMIRQENRVLALDEQGMLFLFEADPTGFRLLDSRRVSERESWAHLGAGSNQIWVRDLEGVTAYAWVTADDSVPAVR